MKIKIIYFLKNLKLEIPCIILDNTEKMQYSDISENKRGNINDRF